MTYFVSYSYRAMDGTRLDNAIITYDKVVKDSATLQELTKALMEQSSAKNHGYVIIVNFKLLDSDIRD